VNSFFSIIFYDELILLSIRVVVVVVEIEIEIVVVLMLWCRFTPSLSLY
tara:strand:- start:57 stop:203 length:147 start_codon:yes stop_codon:yes gene_type:complete